jgi:hypothetical protein
MAGNGEVGVEQNACLLFLVVSLFFYPVVGLPGIWWCTKALSLALWATEGNKKPQPPSGSTVLKRTCINGAKRVSSYPYIESVYESWIN